MPLYVRSGDVLRVPYPGGTAPVGVTWRYMDATGTVVGGLTAQALATNVAILPGSAHTLSSGLFMLRFLQFSDRPEVISVVVTLPYMLTMTPAACRGLIGLNDAELPDADIDLIGAALDLDVLAVGAFRPLLATSQRAQRLVGLHCIVQLEASMRARIAQSQASDNVSFQRFRDLDLGQVLGLLKAEHDEIASDLLGTTAVTDVSNPTIFTLGAVRSDPFPGA